MINSAVADPRRISCSSDIAGVRTASLNGALEYAPAPWLPPSLGAPAAAECRVANLVEEHRALKRIQLRDVRCNLREERVAQNRACLLVAAAARIAKQIRDIDLKCIGQTLQ